MDHVVLFKMRDDATEDRLRETMEALDAMVGKIPQIEWLRVGKTITDRHRGWTHGLIVRLTCTTAEELSAQYSNHEAHLAVLKEFLKGDAAGGRPGVAADVMALDITRPVVTAGAPAHPAAAKLAKRARTSAASEGGAAHAADSVVPTAIAAAIFGAALGAAAVFVLRR